MSGPHNDRYQRGRAMISDDFVAVQDEPDPQPGREIVYAEVMTDIAHRAEVGREKYHTYLMTHNGRNPLVDAYQEALDLVVYLKQALMEQEGREQDGIYIGIQEGN